MKTALRKFKIFVNFMDRNESRTEMYSFLSGVYWFTGVYKNIKSKFPKKKSSIQSDSIYSI